MFFVFCFNLHTRSRERRVPFCLLVICFFFWRDMEGLRRRPVKVELFSFPLYRSLEASG